jgi:nitroreductase
MTQPRDRSPRQRPIHIPVGAPPAGIPPSPEILVAMGEDGAFAVAMLADLGGALEVDGPAAYRTLHWEAGLVGQVLYLEAEALGLRATGIGCFFDGSTHAALGLTDDRVQTLYHFTVGGPVEDGRLSTEPAYPGLEVDPESARSHDSGSDLDD